MMTTTCAGPLTSRGGEPRSVVPSQHVLDVGGVLPEVEEGLLEGAMHVGEDEEAVEKGGAVDELVVWATRFFGRRSRLASAAWSAWRWARPAGRYGRVGEPEENCCDDGMEVGEQRVGATLDVVRVAMELRGSDRVAADEVAEEEARAVC